MTEIERPTSKGLLVKYIKSPFLILTAVFTIYNYDWYRTSDWFVLGVFMMVVSVMPWAMIKAGVASREFIMSSTLAKYKSEYPENIGLNNRVSCHACSGDRIFVRKCNELSKMQEHVCSQCGITLYYSKRSSSFDHIGNDE